MGRRGGRVTGRPFVVSGGLAPGWPSSGTPPSRVITLPVLPPPDGVTELGKRIADTLGPGYRIERELGGGGMSRVFVAEEVALGRRVVVKVLPPEMAASVNAERFQREIRLVASLHHPNIVALITAGGHDDLLWFTMPLVEGEAL